MANVTQWIDPLATITETNLPAPAGYPTGPTLWDYIKKAAQQLMYPQVAPGDIQNLLLGGPAVSTTPVVATPPTSITPTIGQTVTPTPSTGEISKALGATAQPQLGAAVPTGLTPPYIREPKEGEEIAPTGLIPYTREPKEGEIPPTRPIEPPISGQDYSSLLKFMQPEEYNRQVEEIAKMRPKTIEGLVGRAYPTAGTLPNEAAQGNPLQRALLDFFYGMAGGQGTRGQTIQQWRAGRQAQMEKQWAIDQEQREKKWTQDVEWAKANLDQNQQIAFLKLNRQVLLDDQKRASTSQYLAKLGEMNPDALKDPNWQRAFAMVNKIPMEYVNELIKEHTDPKTGKVSMYLDENERFLKNTRAKIETILTLKPDMDPRDATDKVLFGQFSDVMLEMKNELARRIRDYQKNKDAKGAAQAIEAYRELSRIDKNLTGQFGEVMDLINAAVKGNILDAKTAKMWIEKAIKEKVMPITAKAEAEAALKGTKELKPGEKIQEIQLNALKTPTMQIAAMVFPQYAGNQDELAKQVETVQAIMASGPQNDTDQAILDQWRNKQIQYLRGQGRKDLVLKLKNIYGNTLPVQQWQIIVEQVGDGYSDEAILAKQAPKQAPQKVTK